MPESRSQRSVPPQRGGDSGWIARLDSTVDLCLGAVVFVAPLFMGGRGPVGKFVFVSLACLAAVVWCARQAIAPLGKWRWTTAEWLLAVGLGLLVLQLVPLPAPLLTLLSPAQTELLPLWQDANPVGLPVWDRISLYPAATMGALAVFVAYALLFLVVVQRLDTLSDVERMMRWLAAAGIGLALLGLAQFLLSNGKFLWVYEHPFRDTRAVVKGPFQNQNHFAHMLALAVGPLLWWVWKLAEAPGKPQRSSWNATNLRTPTAMLTPAALRNFLFVGLALVSFAALATFSRGGVIAVTATGLLTVALMTATGLTSRRVLWVAAPVLGFVIAGLSIYGQDQFLIRMTTLLESSSLHELSHGREALWDAIGEGIQDFWRMGSGVGTHREVYRIYMDEYYDVEFTHGENGYLPLTLEAGLPGLVLMLCGIVLVAYWSSWPVWSYWRRHEQFTGPHAARQIAVPAIAVLAGVAVSVVHSCGDFVWYISACMSYTVILAACGCRLYQLAVNASAASDSPRAADLAAASSGGLVRDDGHVASRPVWVGIAVMTAGLTAVCVNTWWGAALAGPSWEKYHALALVKDRGSQSIDRADLLNAMERHLTTVVERDPRHARACSRLATVLVQRFELEQTTAVNPMPLSQVRDAALRSQFPSRQAQDEWLSRAVGPNVELLRRAIGYNRRALHLCPLQGEDYVQLMDLAFLDSPNPRAPQAYIQQAVKVRPYSGPIHYVLGREVLVAGGPEVEVLRQLLDHWKIAFNRDPDMRRQIIDSHGAVLPAAFFVQGFQPDLDGLHLLFLNYQRLGRADDARVTAAAFLEQFPRAIGNRRPLDAAALWEVASSIHLFLDAPTKAVAAMRQAVELTPQEPSRRRRLAQLLSGAGQHHEAIQELEWCLRRSPDDPGLAEELAHARVEATRRQAARPELVAPAGSPR